MAIEFLQAQKKQRYLMLILTLVICAILLIVWLGFFRSPTTIVPVSVFEETKPKIEINWDTMSDTKLEVLNSFEQISELKDEIGRENPFTPY